MTQFWFGFITAVAVIAVTIIAAALLSYRRSERKRQAHVDAIMANVTGQGYQPSAPVGQPVPPRGGTAVVKSPHAGKKGIH